MWLLSTDRAELHYFIGPEHVPGGYAILSHVWGEREQTFQETPKFSEDLAPDRPNARDTASEKVRNCCIVAEQDDLHWIWDDTCCIDKSSSAELSEAINSMFRYYSLAEVCYAYLADVPTRDGLSHPHLTAAFQQSKWHTRGWTLQELIAPTCLVFFSGDWDFLGTKIDHAPLLSSITNIPISILRMESEVTSFSVAQRMSWAWGRVTTRIEDRAYSLMGLFSVNMTTIYGEGERAFQRLQEEIMKQSLDTSLFAWDGFTTWKGFNEDEFNTKMGSSDGASQDSPCDRHGSARAYFLAPSPDHFFPSWSGQTQFRWPSSTTRFESARETSVQNPASMPTFTITPYGCLATVVGFQVGSRILVRLACQWIETSADDSESQSLSLWLILSPCPRAIRDWPTLYHTGMKDHNRVIALRDSDVPINISLAPKTVYISLWHTTPGTRSDALSIPKALEHKYIRTPFRMTMDMLVKAFPSWVLASAPTVPFDWVGNPPIVFLFKHRYSNDDSKIELRFVLGRCRREVHIPGGFDGGSHFASFHFHDTAAALGPAQPEDYLAHNCEWDHISAWPEAEDGSRTWSWSPIRGIALSFAPCTLYAGEVLVLSKYKKPIDDLAHQRRRDAYAEFLSGQHNISQSSWLRRRFLQRHERGPSFASETSVRLFTAHPRTPMYPQIARLPNVAELYISQHPGTSTPAVTLDLQPAFTSSRYALPPTIYAFPHVN